MTAQRKNRLLWAFFLGGLILSTILFFPKVEAIGANDPQEFNLPDEAVPPSRFDVPPPKPNQSASPWSRSFLFELAGTDKLSGAQREEKLLARYDDITEGITSTQIPKVTVDTSLGVAVVEIDDKPFATVLVQDCPEYVTRLSPADQLELEKDVAYSWRYVIQEDIAIRAVKQHPIYLQFYNYLAVMGFFFTGTLHQITNWFGRRFSRTPMWSIKALLWVSYLSLLTTLHPVLDTVANLLTRGALKPLFMFVICGVTVLISHQATQIMLHRYFVALSEYDYDLGGSARKLQRRLTIEQAAFFLSQIGWTFVGLCGYLYMLGVDLGSFFAGAGLIGVAIGVMARDIFIDYFNGMNIILEDQFGVGDWIESNNDSGEVVSFSLRATKLRRSDGGLATVPNSDLRRVKNHSSEWSQVDFQVSVSYRTDVDRALDLILEEIKALEEEIPGKIAEPARKLGLQTLGPDGIVLRVLIKTVPLAQWDVQRRLNRRVKIRFDEEGIDFAAPRLSLQVRPEHQREACLAVPPSPETDDSQQPPAP